MRTGEKGILVVIGVIVAALMFYNASRLAATKDEARRGIPFYTDASHDLEVKGQVLYKKYGCNSCHKLWAIENFMRSSVPAPALDGIGSLREAAWLADYMAAENPQKILPSRLKREFQMPSYADMPTEDRQIMLAYLSSLKVKDWYKTKALLAEQKKLTGHTP